MEIGSFLKERKPSFPVCSKTAPANSQEFWGIMFQALKKCQLDLYPYETAENTAHERLKKPGFSADVTAYLKVYK